MAGYGYGISVSGSRTPVVASSTPTPPPSGIPVASTASVVVASIASPYNGANDTYSKKVAFEEFMQFDAYSIRSVSGVCYVSSILSYILVPPNVVMEWSDGDWQNLGSRNYWSLAWIRYNDGMVWAMDTFEPASNYTLRNDSTDASLIPQANWYMYNMDTATTEFTSPLTITAV
jgi:hypothetical protein